jgi:aminopeptidase 2
MLTNVLHSTLSPFNTEQKAQEIESFFQGKEIKGGEKAIAQSIEIIRARAAFVKRDLASIKEYFAQL